MDELLFSLRIQRPVISTAKVSSLLLFKYIFHRLTICLKVQLSKNKLTLMFGTALSCPNIFKPSSLLPDNPKKENTNIHKVPMICLILIWENVVSLDQLRARAFRTLHPKRRRCVTAVRLFTHNVLQSPRAGVKKIKEKIISPETR